MNIAEKLTKVAENEKKVYDAGHENGNKAYYDFFWNGMQNNGNAANYVSRFRRWTNTSIYQPKYDFLHSTSATASPQDMFRECFFTDLKVNNIFNDISILSYTFYQADKLKNARTLHVEAGTAYTSPFYGCTALEEVRFTGTIGKGGLSFASCTKLSKASIESVISCLSASVSGLTITFSRAAVNNAFETEKGMGNGSTTDEWLNLIATKSNWTIALA